MFTIFFPIFQLLFLFFSAFSPKKISQFWIWKFSPFWKSSVEYYLKVVFLFWLPCFLKKNIKAKVFAHQRKFFWPISESLCLRNAKNLYFVFPLDNIGWAQNDGRHQPALEKRLLVLWCTLYRYFSFRKGAVNGLTPEDLVSRALYRSGHLGFSGISHAPIFDEYFNI